MAKTSRCQDPGLPRRSHQDLHQRAVAGEPPAAKVVRQNNLIQHPFAAHQSMSVEHSTETFPFFVMERGDAF